MEKGRIKPLHTGVSTFAIRTSQRNTKNCKRAYSSPTQRKNYCLKFPSLLKIFKTATHSRHKNNPTMTTKLTVDKDYSNSTDRTPAGNSTYKKLAVHWLNEALCFVSSSVVADSFVLRNRQLLVAANR